ncbi:hypothetical protein JCM8547_000218 [Rhodosporidiobolus lusitaniae]
MYKRAFQSTRAALKEHSAAPLRRTKDPLLASSTAQHFLLPSGNHFTVRPPPSSLPPSHPLPPQSNTPAALSQLAQDSPFASQFASSSSSSSSLLPELPASEAFLPPSRLPLPTAERTHLPPSTVAELQQLRRSSSSYWTRSRLAAKFGVSQKVVGTIGWGEGQEAREAERERREQVERKREKKEGQWGWKKSIAREERRRRRTLW